MTKGVLLLATGHHHYGQMAVALAAAIKRYNPDLPVAIACNAEGFRFIDSPAATFFDKVIEVKDDLFKIRGVNSPHRAKLFLDKLTPYDRTLYLDVDSAIWPETDLTPIFDQPDALKFQVEHWEDVAAPKEGSRLYHAANGIKKGKSNTVWFDDAKVVQAYGVTEGVLPSYNASFILFDKKNKEVKKFWEKSREIYDNPKKEVPWQKFAGDMPDEYAFDIASLLLGIRFDYEQYWPLLHLTPPGTHSIKDWKKMSIGFTMYGPNYAIDNPSYKQIYDILNSDTALYWRKKGVSYIPYRYVPKRVWNTDRRPI